MGTWFLSRGPALALLATLGLTIGIGGLALRDADQVTIALSVACIFLVIGALLASTRDLGRQAIAERALRLAAVRLQVTFASCGDALIATNEAGLITLINPVAQALTGWREDEARGLPLEQVFRIVNEFTRETVENPVSKTLREGKVVGLANHTLLIARDGTERPIDDSGAPIRDESGEVSGVILVFRDVTSRKLSEQARERLIRAESEREAAVVANRAKDDFLAVLSHELRNPLAAMLGWVEVIQTGKLTEAEKERAIGGIQRSALQQKRLVSDLLDISRIIVGHLPIERGPLDLDALVAAGVEARRGEAEAAGLRLVYARPGAPVIVAGDAERLDQVLQNLLSNAIKFTEPGGQVDVTLGVAEQARIVVADTGVGISSDQLGHVFERFWQSAGPRARKLDGLGLGLAIAKHIVERHDGAIRVESAGAGQGASFSVDLPLELGSKPLEERGMRRGDRGLDGIRVLLVDDNVDGRDAMATLLAQQGALVTTAGTVAEAMRALRAERFAVVVTDVGMPREDGFSLLRQIRQLDQDRHRHTATIAVTGYVSGEDRTQALAAGFDEHVGKPAETALLLERIRAVVAAANRSSGSG